MPKRRGRPRKNETPETEVLGAASSIPPSPSPRRSRRAPASDSAELVAERSVRSTLTADEAKDDGEKLRERLFRNTKNGYDRIDAKTADAAAAFGEDYKAYLDESKTERESVAAAIRLAEKKGFKPYTSGMDIKAGDKLYLNNRNKYLLLAAIGSRPLSDGANIIAAHIDVPRIDLKANPLYEDSDLAYFKTHYYGGIKKYQWLALPLALKGVVVLSDGTAVDISIGDNPDEPVFTITDILPHLGKDQAKKPLGEAVEGESLNILAGSIPYPGEGSDRVRLNVLRLLNEKYGIVEQDFKRADLSLVPAGPSRDVGLDRSLIGGYGHDDRVCAYTALRAILDGGKNGKTSVCILADREEIGSEGVTGMKSKFFDTFMEDICEAQDVPLRRCFENSACLSADVSNAYDPNFPETSDKRNNSVINGGICLSKYVGSRGKSGTNEASAELLGRVAALFDNGGALWQVGELGKVDQGGGGTVAMYIANRNIETVDCGVPVLSMHAPFELVSKLDVYMTCLAMKAFYSEKE